MVMVLAIQLDPPLYRLWIRRRHRAVVAERKGTQS